MPIRGWVAVVAGLLVVGCGDSGGDSNGSSATGDDVPAECQAPPLSMRLEGLSDPPAGDAEFEVTDAVARRVPILPGEREPTGDPEVLADNQEEAAETDLALYSVYLADFAIDRGELEGFGFGDVEPEAGGTIGTLTIVPTNADGFSTGDVVIDDELDYDVTTTFATLGLTVRSSERASGDGYTDVVGQVEILHLDDDVICLDIDVALENSGEPVVAAEGVVAAPVVRAPERFYFT